MIKLIYLIVVTMFVSGCSSNRIKGEIPQNLNVYTVLNKSGEKSIVELLDLYKEDIQKAKGRDYETNLKNMWLIRLNPRVLNSGTQDEKLYLLKEQEKMENNLPHINNYYKLLGAVNIDKAEKMNQAKSFYDKNKQAISEINWHTAEEKTQKETELVMAFRNFGIQQQFSE